MFFLCFSLAILIGIYYFVNVLPTFLNLKPMKARTYQFMMTALLFLQVTKVTYGQSILSENDSLVINKYHVNPTQQSPN